MAKTKAQIIAEAQVVKNATEVGENTATRVGGVLEDLATDGTTFSTGEFIGDVGIDATPAQGSNNLVKSGGVYSEVSQLGQQVIYDVSANNDEATFASLSALLSSENLSTLIPIAVRCGGMSIRFVQSSDNKYVQYRLMATTWSINVSDWQEFVILPDIQEDIFNILENTTNTCYFADGTTYKGQNWTSGEKQAIPEYRMAGKMKTYKNMPAVVFFDSDDNMCGYIGNLSYSGIVTYDTDIDGIPNDAVTFQLQGSNKSTDVAAGQCVVYYPLTTLKDRVLQLEEDEIVKITIKNVIPSVGTSTYRPDGTMYNYGGGWGIAQGNYNVQSGDKLIGLIKAHPNVPPIVFFDNSNNFICTMPTVEAQAYREINIVVPENAAYFIVQSRNIVSDRNNLAIHRTVNSCLEGMVNVYGDNEDSFPALSLIIPRTFYSVLNNITADSKRTNSTVFYLDNFFTGVTKEPKSVFFKNYVRKIGIRFPNIGNTGYVEETLDYSIIGNTVENQDFSIKHRACLLSPSKDKKISVICIGDSITYGQNAYFVDRVEQRSYPMIINEVGYKDYLESQQQGYSVRLLGRNKITHSFTYNDNNYTISTFHEGRQGDSLQRFMSRPENQDAGGNFSLAAYIEKYRTCDDNGNRLYFDVNQGTTGTAGANNTGYLADGTDSGFKIGSTISNTLSVDVYKPSHIFLFMCTNVSYSVENLETFITGIKTAGNDIIIGVGCPHYAGTYFPSDYQDFIGAEHWVLGESTPQITQQTLLNTLDRETYESENVFFIDTYWTNQGAWSASCAQANELAADFVNDSVFKKYRPVGQGIYQHVSAYAHAAYAQQIYAWLKWTAAKNLFNR